MPEVATTNKTEGFSLSGSGDLNYALSSFGFTRGSSSLFDWEDGSSEGFTISGTGCYIKFNPDAITESC